jgi:hypothetical protein
MHSMNPSKKQRAIAKPCVILLVVVKRMTIARMIDVSVEMIENVLVFIKAVFLIP